MKLIILLALFFVSELTFATGTETGNGGDGVLHREKVTLLDSLEYDFELVDIQSYQFSTELNFILDNLASKLEVNIVRPQDLVWALTNRKLEDIKDEGAIRHPIEGKLVQIAVQREGVVVIQKNLFNLLQSEESEQNDKLGLILHEVLIATALKYNLDLKIPDLGTAPIRKLVWYSRQKVSSDLPDSLFKKIWQKLPYIFGEVSINFDNNSFHIDNPKALFGSKLYPIEVVHFETYNQEAAWCYYFAKKLNLASSNQNYKSYQGKYGSIQTYSSNILAVSTGVSVEHSINNYLIFSPVKSSWAFSWITCRKVN